MTKREKEFERLAGNYEECSKFLVAIGDPIRYKILAIMMEGECSGSRVAAIAEKTSLSRPAVSHHMQILKDAGIVKSRKEGTLIYYYVDPEMSELDKIIAFFTDVKKFMKDVPDRSKR